MDARTKRFMLTMSFLTPTNVYTGLQQAFVVSFLTSVAEALHKHLAPTASPADLALAMCFTGEEGWLREVRRHGYRILNVSTTGVAAIEVSRGRFYTYDCEQLCLTEPFHSIENGILRITAEASAIFWGRTKIGDAAETTIQLDTNELEFLQGKRVMFVSEVRKSDRTYHVIETTSEADASVDDAYVDVKRELALRVRSAVPDVTDLVGSDTHLSLLASNLMSSSLAAHVRELDLPMLLGIIDCESQGHISDFNLRVLADRVGSALAPGKIRYASVGAIGARLYDLAKARERPGALDALQNAQTCDCPLADFVGPMRRLDADADRDLLDDALPLEPTTLRRWRRHECRLISYSSRDVTVGPAAPYVTIYTVVVGAVAFVAAMAVVVRYKPDSVIETAALGVTFLFGMPLLAHRIAYKGWNASDAVRGQIVCEKSDVLEAAIGWKRTLLVLDQVQNPAQLFDAVNSCGFVGQGMGSFSISRPITFEEMMALGMRFVLTPDLQEAVQHKGCTRALSVVENGVSHVGDTLPFTYGIPSSRGALGGKCGAHPVV